MINVWCTDSVDTSAMLLAQGLDGELYKGEIEDQDVVEELTREDSTIVFYGILERPDWFFDHFPNNDKVFNSPDITKQFINRVRSMRELREGGIPALTYLALKGDTNYTRVRESLGVGSFDLITKGNMEAIAAVNNANEYNAARNGQNVKFAARHYNRVGKYRVFVGFPTILDNPILGVSFSEKRMLTYIERLKLGRSEEVKANIDDMVDKGILAENQGEGIEAWSEEEHVLPTNFHNPDVMQELSDIATRVQERYEADFIAVDIFKAAGGELMVSSLTGSPSLQADAVLGFVAPYFKQLSETGRAVGTDSFLKFAGKFTDAQAQKAYNLIKNSDILEA